MLVETYNNPKVLEPNTGLPSGNPIAPNPSPAPIVREAAGMTYLDAASPQPNDHGGQL